MIPCWYHAEVADLWVYMQVDHRFEVDVQALHGEDAGLVEEYGFAQA